MEQLTAHGAFIVHPKDGAAVDSNSPIAYDEERVFLVGDLFNKVEDDLIAQAATGLFLGGANVSFSPMSFLISDNLDKWENLGRM